MMVPPEQTRRNAPAHGGTAIVQGEKVVATANGGPVVRARG